MKTTSNQHIPPSTNPNNTRTMNTQTLNTLSTKIINKTPKPVQKLITKNQKILLFCFIGGIAYIIDSSVFYLVQYGPGEILQNSPLKAKITSVFIATIFSWIGNKTLTFKHQKSKHNTLTEAIAFIIINLIGLLISLACLGFTHYILGYYYTWAQTPLTDFISANIIGFILGTIYRFHTYNTKLFSQTKQKQ